MRENRRFAPVIKSGLYSMLLLMSDIQTSKPSSKISHFLSRTHKIWFWSSFLIFLYEFLPISLAAAGLFSPGMPLYFLKGLLNAFIENANYGFISSINLMIYVCPITAFISFKSAQNRYIKIISLLLCLQAILQLAFWTVVWSTKH